MKIYDISTHLHNEMALWPGSRPGFRREYAASMKAGDGRNVSYLSMSSHAGTHVDAPYHHLADGERVDQIALNRFMLHARLFDLSSVRGSIGPSVVERLDLPSGGACLFKTANSGMWEKGAFDRDYVHLQPEAARLIASSGVGMVGVDGMSVDGYGDESVPSHRALMEADVIILEGLDLSEVGEGDYQLIAFPMKVSGAEAAPTRAVLLACDGEESNRHG